MGFAVDYRVILLIAASVIALFPFDAGAQEGDATAGATVFKKCATCHVAESDTNKVGPSLNKLFGRTAGTHPDFAYSAAMKAAGEGGLVWDEATLRDYLHNPKAKVKGTKMAFAGVKDDQEITNLIAYLKQYSQ
ncbi:cytochrome-c class 1 protein [Rhizobium sp. N6212]|nr:cytochrome-c class 1 protein [Rhizobium sp. N731]ANK92187.1 cytochrome-c class 1 protein [Rhizobium sp. N6212]ANK98227.1 cytochrome-c class 1 protein [Rhizobium sp. N621]ANL04307.1 cytochrome-c class 1 protein [Rhizobium esperanzae]ANL10419.1 cytochrome-c class 1 protein [Rhizobium sp. N1341]ANL16519.1 cytochrome-c class 1 protein [Rhizobium sp. N1314]ANL22472.1 cytochrome-c class 1 protein [Rhizobium sp. N113]ANM35150.1 cytochrome-c class 1 protein [Rhizobium sp. N871]ANM41262.1 cytochr